MSSYFKKEYGIMGDIISGILLSEGQCSNFPPPLPLPKRLLEIKRAFLI